MASATSGRSKVTTGTSVRNRRENYYQTQVTTLADGSVKRETFRTDVKGNNQVKISEVTADKDGNITNDTTLSTASTEERRALQNPNSQLRNSIRQQTDEAGKEAKANSIDPGGDKATDKAGGGSGNTATDTGEGGSQPSGEPSKPAPGVNKGINGGTYPIDIGSTKQDVIKFDMLKYRPSKFEDRPSVDSIDASKIIETVILAVPGGIQDQNTASWTGESMDPMQKELARTAFETIGEGPQEGITKAIDRVKENFKTAGGEMKQVVQGIFAGKAAGVGQQVFQRGQGQVMNPNMELLFSGPSLRQFTFNFLLAPRSESEQQQVVNIIRFFKQGMSPIKSEFNLFLKSPNTFRLRYIHRGSGEDSEHKFLTKFKECALTSTGVNYTPNTNYATFKDGGMVAYQLALTFQELEPVFNNDYAKVTDGIGY